MKATAVGNQAFSNLDFAWFYWFRSDVRLIFWHTSRNPLVKSLILWGIGGLRINVNKHQVDSLMFWELSHTHQMDGLISFCRKCRMIIHVAQQPDSLGTFSGRCRTNSGRTCTIFGNQVDSLMHNKQVHILPRAFTEL